MFDRSTKLFLRWRDRGDADALAAVFDRTAPELLRIALNLCGNVADAEDVLQATFLAAIESAPRFERGKRVVPWLVAILTHRAHAERRRRDRSPATGAEPDTLPGRTSDPAQQVAGQELDRATRDALDRLPEPYRQPTMLRVLHGLEPANIALLLQRSPGTVRAQIHRGIEQLRRLLPVGIAMTFATGAGVCGRGLPAVRSIVLAEARRVATTTAVSATAATTLLVAGMTMSKKSAFLAVALLCSASILGVALLRGGAEAPPLSGEQRANVVVAAPGARSDGQTLEPAPPSAATAERTIANYEPQPGSWSLSAQVVDGPSGTPISGADVTLHGPRTMTLLELQRELADFTTPGPTGIPWSPWLSLPHELPLEVIANGGSHPFLVPPTADAPALAHAETDASGTFRLSAPATGAVISVRHAGYGIRQVAVEKPPDAQLRIELWPTRQIVGFVRTDHDEIPPERLELTLRAESGIWFTQTDAQGRFAAEVATDRVHVESRTPGWTVTPDHFPPSGGRWHGTRDLKVAEQGTVYVTRFGATRLHVLDAATRQPIETIGLVTSDEDGYPHFCGRFLAPAGFFSLQHLDIESVVDRPKNANWHSTMHAHVTVWSDGYQPFSCRDVELYGTEPATIEVALQRGSLDTLRGRVVRGPKAIADAEVRLRPLPPLQWQSHEDRVLAIEHTATDGAFTFQLPPGDYVCEVFVDKTMATQSQIAIPDRESLVIDLGDAVFVDVQVVDAQGEPQADHNVSVRAAPGQNHRGRTDAGGHIMLGPFPPGELRAMAPLAPAKFSWVGKVFASITASAGARPAITLQLPSKTTIRPLLRFDGPASPTSFAGFVALDVTPITGKADAAVEPDGTVPIDLTPGDATVRISGPEGRRWQFELPADARPGHVLSLRWSGLAYTGVVVKADDSPVANARVFATPSGGGTQVSALTDARGAFRLDGLEPCTYVLGFHRDGKSPYRESANNPYSMQLFFTSSPPAPDPVRVRVQLTRFEDGKFVGLEELVITGRAVDTAEQPIAAAVVSVRTLVTQGGGTLEVFPRNGWQHADADGSFRIVVARGDRYRSSVTRKAGEPMQTEEFSVTSREPEVRRDLVVR